MSKVSIHGGSKQVSKEMSKVRKVRHMTWPVSVKQNDGLKANSI